MGKAYECDLCELLEPGEPVAGVTFILPETVPKTQNQELCTECHASLRDWMQSRRALRIGRREDVTE